MDVNIRCISSCISNLLKLLITSRTTHFAFHLSHIYYRSLKLASDRHFFIMSVFNLFGSVNYLFHQLHKCRVTSQYSGYVQDSRAVPGDRRLLQPNNYKTKHYGKKEKIFKTGKEFSLTGQDKGTPPDYFTEFIGLEISKHSFHLRDTPNQLCSNSRKNKLIPDWFSPLLLVSKPQRLKLKKKLQKKLKKAEITQKLRGLEEAV